jgi:AraC family transcriptional regulator
MADPRSCSANPASPPEAARSPLDVLLVPVPSGRVESPLEDRHALDFHLGGPVQVSCRMEGRERSGFQTHGLFCVLPAGGKARWMMSRSARAMVVLFSPSLFRDTAEAIGLRARDGELLPAIHVRDPQIERLGWVLQAEHEDDYPSGKLFTDSVAAALAARLLALQARRGEEPSGPRRALPAWRLRNVLDYVEAHLDQDLSLAELAAVAGFSASHFKALFKQAVGLPVHRYVLERRVERARALLSEGRQRTMADVALEAGFSHPSHMARCMRRVLGVSPSEVTRSRPTAGAPPRR